MKDREESLGLISDKETIFGRYKGESLLLFHSKAYRGWDKREKENIPMEVLEILEEFLV